MSGIRAEASVQCLILFWIATIAVLCRAWVAGCFGGEKFLKEPRLEETITFMSLAEPRRNKLNG